MEFEIGCSSDSGMGMRKMKEEDEMVAIREAASVGMKSMENIVRLLSSSSSSSSSSSHSQIDVESTVSNLNNLITALKSNHDHNHNPTTTTTTTTTTGHARFRRAPIHPPVPTYQSNTNTNTNSNSNSSPKPPLALDFTNSNPNPYPPSQFTCNTTTSKCKWMELNPSFTISANSSSSFFSTITGDGSVSNNSKPILGLGLSNSKPPVFPSKNNKMMCHDLINKTTSSKCHCSKAKQGRKLRVKERIRVAAVDKPSDEYSWRKYGQKPIKGSPYPRNYYRCSSCRGCPAKKHVERALDDPTMLILTYQGQHRHQSTININNNINATTNNNININTMCMGKGSAAGATPTQLHCLLSPGGQY